MGQVAGVLSMQGNLIQAGEGQERRPGRSVISVETEWRAVMQVCRAERVDFLFRSSKPQGKVNHLPRPFLFELASDIYSP